LPYPNTVLISSAEIVPLPSYKHIKSNCRYLIEHSKSCLEFFLSKQLLLVD
jgi:hypothetical protein